MIGLIHDGDLTGRECSARFGGAVADTAALALIPSQWRVDGMVCVTHDTRSFWMFDSTSSASAADDTIVPSSGTGRWLATSPYVLARWEDTQPSRVSVGQGTAAPTTQAYGDTPMQFDFARHDQKDIWFFSYQMSHRWAIGSVVNPHVHLIPTAAGSGNIIVSGQYAWTQADSGQALPANASWTTFKKTLAVTAANKDCELAIGFGVNGITPPAWAGHSAHLHIVWQIDGSDPSDTYKTSSPFGMAQANRAIVSFDCHAQLYPSGSVQQYIN